MYVWEQDVWVLGVEQYVDCLWFQVDQVEYVGLLYFGYVGGFVVGFVGQGDGQYDFKCVFVQVLYVLVQVELQFWLYGFVEDGGGIW